MKISIVCTNDTFSFFNTYISRLTYVYIIFGDIATNDNKEM